MEWKKFGRKLFCLPVWLIIILTVISAAALIYVFTNDLSKSVPAYGVYVISFYTLVSVCVFLAGTLPKQYRRVRQAVYDNPLGNRYLTDVEFKTHVSLYCSFGVNLLYVGTNIFSAWLYRSAWFGILAGYYMILAVMRFLLARDLGRNTLYKERFRELQCVRICAAILTMISLVLFGEVFMILDQNKGFEYHGVLIYVMAMYTFYMTISAVADLVKYRKYNNSILSMSKVIKTAAALVSMLALETAMFSQFGGNMAQEDQQIMIIATGAGISLLVITMAVYMGVRSTRGMEEIRRQDDYGKHAEL